MAVMLITHDLGVVAEVADEVIVMYAGRVMEQASVDRPLRRPQHPYTRACSQQLPRLDEVRKERLIPSRGAPT